MARQVMPEADEVATLTSFKGNVAELAETERLLIEMAHIPKLKNRLQVYPLAPALHLPTFQPSNLPAFQPSSPPALEP